MSLWTKKQASDPRDDSNTVTEPQDGLSNNQKGQENSYPTGARLCFILLALFLAAFLTALDISIVATVSFDFIATRHVVTETLCWKMHFI